MGKFYLELKMMKQTSNHFKTLEKDDKLSVLLRGDELR